jgi:hypothetical protein
VLAEGVGLGAGVRGQVIEVGGVGFRFHIPDGRVLVEDGEVGSSDGGARRLVNEGQVGAQRAQQAFQRAVVGEFACRAGLLRHCAQVFQVVYQRVHARESVPDGVGGPEFSRAPNWRVLPRCVPVPLRGWVGDAQPPPAARESLPKLRA